jgi:hypothetical protein
MARIVYIECTAGISGDMLLGALVDAGLPLDYLRDELSALCLEGWSISAGRTHRNHIGATGFKVDAEEEAPARH